MPVAPHHGFYYHPYNVTKWRIGPSLLSYLRPAAISCFVLSSCHLKVDSNWGYSMVFEKGVLAYCKLDGGWFQLAYRLWVSTLRQGEEKADLRTS